MKKAHAYIRFSSDIQAHGDSMRRQKQLVSKWLEQHPDYHLVSTYQDTGVSAYHGKHADTGELGKLLQDIQNGAIQPPDAILIESLDRLSRENIEAATERLRSILRSGLHVFTLSDGKEYTPDSLNNAMDLIMAILIATRAHEESEAKSKRMREVWSAKRRAAVESGKVLTKMCPKWLCVNSDRTGFTIVPEHVETLNLMFQMRVAGKGFAAIAQELNQMGRVTFKGSKGVWNQSTVQQLISNRAVIGYHAKNRKSAVKEPEVPDYYPVVVPLDVFQAAQLRKEQRFGRKPSNPRPDNIHLFKGTMKCRHCGGAIVLNSVCDTNRGYYTCSLKRLGRCTSRNVKREIVDDSLVKGLLYHLDRLTLSHQGESPLNALEARREDLTGRSSKLVQALELAPDITEITSRLKSLKDEVQAIDSQIEAIKSRSQASTVATVQGLDMSTRENRLEVQLLVKKTFDRILLDTDAMKVDIYLNNGLELLNVPVDRVVDSGQWLELLEVIEASTLDFDKLTVKNPPRYL